MGWCVFFFHSFPKIDSEIVDEQLKKLDQIAALPMSSNESKTIKPLITVMGNLLREWIVADKDVKVDAYALKKMMVRNSLHVFSLSLAFISINVFERG